MRCIGLTDPCVLKPWVDLNLIDHRDKSGFINQPLQVIWVEIRHAN